MTIHTEVQKMLESKEFTPAGCIQNTRDHGIPLLAHAERIVVVSSLTCQLHGLLPTYESREGAGDGGGDRGGAADRKSSTRPRRGRTDVDSDDDDGEGRVAMVVTIDDVYARVAAQIARRAARSERVVEYVLNADKRDWVPPEKHATQARRAAHMELYPEGTRIHGNGIVLPRRPDDAKAEDDVDAVAQPFHLPRLLMTRALREPLYRALLTRMQDDPQLRGLCVSCDLTHEPPVRLGRDGQMVAAIGDEWRRVGEDDILMILWARRRRGGGGGASVVHHNHGHGGGGGSGGGGDGSSSSSGSSSKHDVVFLDSLDRDSLALSLLQHRSFEQQALVLWFGDGRYVWPMQMADQLLGAGWTVAMFVQLMMLGGCDFLGKAELTRNIGIVPMFAAGLALLQERPDCFDLVHDRRHLRLWLRILYSNVLGLASVATPRQIADNIAERDLKKWSWPSDVAIAAAHRRLSWTFHYWQSLHFTLYTI